MRNNSERSLKSLNIKWLVLLATADVLGILFFVAPKLIEGASFAQAGIGRLLITMVIPVIVLLIVNVLPHNVKSALVYWKQFGVLPGSEAFTKYGPDDSRIDMKALEKNIGILPTDPAEQNAKWYKLYRLVANEPEVTEAHKLFLMYRDMAVLSLALVVLVPVSLYGTRIAFPAPWIAAGVFAAQYLITALSARWSGIRFVSNVLAVHSVQEFATLKANGNGEDASGAIRG